MAVAVEWALAEIDDLEAWVGDDRNTYINLFENLITQISAFMEDYTDRKLKARDYSYLVAADSEDALGDGDGRTNFFTKQYPINSVTTLIIGDTTISAASDWDETGYFIYKNRGKIYYAYGFDAYRKNIKLVYNAGYATDTREYATLNLICCALIKYVWDNRSKLGLQQEVIGRYRYTRANFEDTDKWIFSLLDNFKRGVFK